MDAIIIVALAIYWALTTKSKKSKIVQPPVGTNDSFYRDEEAFKEIFEAILKK